MKLTDHFALEEMTLSQTAVRRGLANAPGEQEIDNLRQLCALVLEPLRDRLERPIVVSSGYRSPEVNAAVGGAPNSDHMRGCAADINCPGLTSPFLMAEIVRVGAGLPIKQAILEFSRWCHVSIDLDAEAPEFLIATNFDSKTVYTKWVNA